MSDVDLSEFYKLSRPRKPPCRVGVALAQLNGAEKDQLEAALATDSGLITNGAIQAWLAAREHETVSPSAITSHRRRTCTCHGS